MGESSWRRWERKMRKRGRGKMRKRAGERERKKSERGGPGSGRREGEYGGAREIPIQLTSLIPFLFRKTWREAYTDCVFWSWISQRFCAKWSDAWACLALSIILVASSHPIHTWKTHKECFDPRNSHRQGEDLTDILRTTSQQRANGWIWFEGRWVGEILRKGATLGLTGGSCRCIANSKKASGVET
eukprot:2875650-Rhodomonas_salina.1